MHDSSCPARKTSPDEISWVDEWPGIEEWRKRICREGDIHGCTDSSCEGSSLPSRCLLQSKPRTHRYARELRIFLPPAHLSLLVWSFTSVDERQTDSAHDEDSAWSTVFKARLVTCVHQAFVLRKVHNELQATAQRSGRDLPERSIFEWNYSKVDVILLVFCLLLCLLTCIGVASEANVRRP